MIQHHMDHTKIYNIASYLANYNFQMCDVASWTIISSIQVYQSMDMLYVLVDYWVPDVHSLLASLASAH